MWLQYLYSNIGCKFSRTHPYGEKRLRERERKVRTQLDNASGNMSHLTFSGLLHALYDKKRRGSGADTHHQSSPTPLPFSPLCTLTTAPNVLQTYPPPGHLSECLKNYRVICLSFLQTYWIQKLHIHHFITFVESCTEPRHISLTNSEKENVFLLVFAPLIIKQIGPFATLRQLTSMDWVKTLYEKAGSYPVRCATLLSIIWSY